MSANVNVTIDKLQELAQDANFKLGMFHGQKLAVNELIAYLEMHLGPDIAVNTSLNSKEAYRFGLEYVELLRLKFEGEQK